MEPANFFFHSGPFIRARETGGENRVVDYVYLLRFAVQLPERVISAQQRFLPHLESGREMAEADFYSLSRRLRVFTLIAISDESTE
jgi:hypothetical protein